MSDTQILVIALLATALGILCASALRGTERKDRLFDLLMMVSGSFFGAVIAILVSNITRDLEAARDASDIIGAQMTLVSHEITQLKDARRDYIHYEDRLCNEDEALAHVFQFHFLGAPDPFKLVFTSAKVVARVPNSMFQVFRQIEAQVTEYYQQLITPIGNYCDEEGRGGRLQLRDDAFSSYLEWLEYSYRSLCLEREVLDGTSSLSRPEFHVTDEGHCDPPKRQRD